MPETTAHIINHTHWDREWFLTSVYTSRWIPGLLEKLSRLAAENPDFKYLFDGQTLVIHDLLEVTPEQAGRARQLIDDGHLIIGPYYCQPDWQLTGGELLLRNLLYGQQDVARFGGSARTGWLVDTFGHISQAPQIHRLFDIEAVFVWRGVPQLVPYFHWQGPDGDRLLAVNLFGGYRNLYGVTHAPEVAVTRLQAEVDRLRPYYPTPDIPLFDGYDLEDNPEDPLTFYKELGGVGQELALRETTPDTFAAEIQAKGLSLPALTGELNSGKYGATFPGTSSARTYLKVMARDCQHLLYRVTEPLAALARLRGRPRVSDQYERWGRILLQNAVHDCICGVSIDQVHEKMEYHYRQVFDGLLADIQESLGALMGDFAPGDYAVSTNPFPAESWLEVGGTLVGALTKGIGVWPVTERLVLEDADEPADSFTWRNDYYQASLDPDGVVTLDGERYGTLAVLAEEGDTYSAEPGERLGLLRPTSTLTVVQKSSHHRVVAYETAWQNETIWVTATVRVWFDHSPLIRWQIDLDSRGTNLRVEMSFETGRAGEIFAGMPFDVVQRPFVDRDLLSRELPEDLAKLLLGQRELDGVRTFPFHEYVALADRARTTAVLARGLHDYRADETGRISLTLRRAVEWLTRADLPNRVGDAGPFFYVPDARCERQVRHEVAVASDRYAADSMALQALNAAYQNPPLIVRVPVGPKIGPQRTWLLLQENAPLSSLHQQEDAVLARFYNPTPADQQCAQTYQQTDVWGRGIGETSTFPAKEVVTVRLTPEAGVPTVENGEVQLLTPLTWRVGKNTARPQLAILDRLATQIMDLEEELAATQQRIDRSQGAERLRQQHRYYVLDRQRLEYKLSHLLNRRKLAEPVGDPSLDYLFGVDEEIAAVGLALNRLRIKRRIFDYVVAAL